jgi:hypothetical protein
LGAANERMLAMRTERTGEKYITKYRNSFRVNIRRKGIYKQFKTLEEAKEFKKEVYE